jgi:hypothetical protein
LRRRDEKTLYHAGLSDSEIRSGNCGDKVQQKPRVAYRTLTKQSQFEQLKPLVSFMDGWMRDHFSLLISPVLVLLGAVLVYDGAVSQDVSQSMRVIAGAALLALGLMLVQFTFRNWLKERARMPRNRSREA